MAAIDVQLQGGALPVLHAKKKRNLWDLLAQKRLTDVFKASPEIPFDDQSRLVFFSDSHRGANGSTDAFAPNEGLFLHALQHYYDKGYTYIEVGDGDELWKNRHMGAIVKAHPRTFTMLHRFHHQKRLHIILGNHDFARWRERVIEKDHIPTTEGLVLQHKRSPQRIFVVHGHQADLKSDSLSVLSRMTIRYVWKYVQMFGIRRHKHHVSQKSPHKIECRIIEWSRYNQQIVICGHTHKPMIATYNVPPYFNSGSCIGPHMLTGLEIQRGDILLVKWTKHPVSGTIQRELIAPARRLSVFN